MEKRTVDINHLWIRQLKAGDNNAATHLYNQYSKAMYNTLVRLTGDSIKAQDLLQESFLKAFKNIDSFRGNSTFGAWLKRIVINTGLEDMRKKKLEIQELSDEHVMLAEVIEDEQDYDPQIIHDCIKNLPNGSRTVLSLYLLEGYTHKEISVELGISLSTSKTQYMRGKALLQKQLKDKIYG